MPNEIKVRFIKPKRSNALINPIKLLRLKPATIFSSLLLGLTVAGLFSATLFVFAVPPTSKYSPGETTDPSCGPTDTNCTVVSAVPYTGATANVDLGSKTLTTTGAGSFGTVNGLTITSSTGTLTVTNAKTLSVSNTLTFTGTDSSSIAFGAGGTVAYAGGTLAQFAATTSAELAGVISDETGSGVLVFGTSPVFTTSLSTSAAGVRISDDGDGAITFLGIGDGTTDSDEDLTLNLEDTSNVGTFTSSTSLATLNFSSIALQESGIAVLNNDEIDASSELLAIMDDETGTGALVFANTPSLTTPALGAATGTSVTLTNTGGAQASFKYDTSNYASFTAGSTGDLTIATISGTGGGDVVIDSATTGDAKILTTNGNLVLGGNSGTNNEALKFDFETTANEVALSSGTGATNVDFGSLTLETTGTLTLGGSTAGTLVTRVKAGAADEADANGSLVVDSSNGRFYFRYGGAWHYVAQTAGFQIPDFETIDPISGEQIQEGDIVLGMINHTFDDNALHGVWVKWESVKAQLLAEARGESVDFTKITGNGVAGVNQETFFDKVTNALFSLGISVKNGVTSIKQLAVQKSDTEIARIKKLELVDSESGDIYCTWIKDGEWQKTKGECGSVEVAIVDSQMEQQANETVQQAANQAASQAAEQVVQQVTDQASQEAQAQIQEEVQAQIEEQVAAGISEQIATEVQEQVVQEVQAQLEAQQEADVDSKEQTPSEDSVKPEKDEKEPKEEKSPEVPVEIDPVSAAEEQPVESQSEAPVPESELAPELEPTPMDVPVDIPAELIQESAAALMQKMGQFFAWFFGAIVPDPVKKSSVAFVQISQEILHNSFGYVQQYSVLLKDASATLFVPVKDILILIFKK